MKWKRKAFLVVIFLLVLTNFFVWKEIFNLSKGVLKVVFFDIGQGDAIFVETFQGHQILIDGGPGKKILEKLAENIPFWDNSLDLVILTHPDADHLSGLNYVLRRYKVENILWTGVGKGTKTFEYWQENLEKEKKEEKANIIIAQRGQRIKAGNAEIYILYPFQNIEGEFFEKNTNDTSVVSKLLFFKNSFLFTGDITEKIEKQILEKEIDPPHQNFGVRAQVLKVSHHGSKSSSSGEFLKAVEAEIAVISCGRNNPYGHPHQSVLRNLEEFGISILNTYQEGDIKIISDGAELFVQ